MSFKLARIQSCSQSVSFPPSHRLTYIICRQAFSIPKFIQRKFSSSFLYSTFSTLQFLRSNASFSTVLKFSPLHRIILHCSYNFYNYKSHLFDYFSTTCLHLIFTTLLNVCDNIYLFIRHWTMIMSGPSSIRWAMTHLAVRSA